jgi:hypothetical protein
MCSTRELAIRLREVRLAVYGVHGGPELARCLGLPYRTWCNYEQGITIPGAILLAFVVETGVDPDWLLHGEGPMFSRSGKPHEVSPVAQREPR